MTDLITEDITGKPITVTLAGREFPLSYPMHNLLLFKKLTGLSLFAGADVWAKLDFQDNFEIWLACLWAGLHGRQADRSWKAPYTLEELELMVGLNAATLSERMLQALAQFLPEPKPKPAAEGEDKKKAAEWTASTPIAPIATPLTISPASGSAPIVVSGSVGTNT